MSSMESEDAPQPGAYAAVGARLVERNYAAVPIIPGRKRPGSMKRGEWVGLTDWNTEYTRRLPSRFETQIWSQTAAGVGVVCGPASKHLVGVDIDSDDPAIVAAIVGVLPPTTVIKCGAKGRTLIYRGSDITESPSWNIGGTRVCDLIGPGRQMVMPPSLHPSDVQYRYIGPDALEDIDPADLAEITPDHIAAIGEALKPLGYESEPEREPLEPAEYSGGGGDSWKRLNAKAMANFDAWVPALNLYRGRRKPGGYEAVATWRPSNTGQRDDKRKLNLSIHQKGITDFGDNNHGYSPIDLVMAALEIDNDSAFDWLEERIDPSPVVIALKPKAKPTMAATAKPMLTYPDGWILDLMRQPKTPPPTFEVYPGGPRYDVVKKANGFYELVDQDGVSEAELREAAGEDDNIIRPAEFNGPRIIMPEAPKSLNPYDDLDRLAVTDGLVGDIVKWICDTSRRPSPWLALGTAVTVIGTIAGGWLGGPSGSGTQLYVLVLAPTGAGKQHLLSTAGRLMTAANVPHLLGPSSFMSESAVINLMQRQPVSLCRQDEWGTQLAKMNNKNSSGHEKGIARVLKAAWGASFESWETPEWAGRPSETMNPAALSLLGMSTHDEFYLDDRFHESCHKRGIHLGFRTPI